MQLCILPRRCQPGTPRPLAETALTFTAGGVTSRRKQPTDLIYLFIYN